MNPSSERADTIFDRIGSHWYASCTGVLTLCFIALAVFWVNLVPQFEAPDEPSHFDYVYALATAGHLLRAVDGPTAYDPRVRTLMKSSGLSRLAFHPAQRVARDYGTAEYRQKIERVLAGYKNYSPSQVGAARPVLISVYPFVPYALYALAIFPFRHDALAALTAGRYASVLFSAIGLLVWSRILLHLRVRKVHALALLTIFTFFPLSSFVASYVQPDGVAFLIVAFLLWTALRIRDGKADLLNGCSYGLALAALSGSKLQYFVAMGIATLVPVSFAYTRASVSTRTRTIVASFGIIATAFAFGSSQWLSQSPTNASYFQGKHSLTAALEGQGVIGSYRTLWTAMSVAFDDLFLRGIASRSFWGVFGWLDTPIHIVDFKTSEIFAIVETVGTSLVMVALLAALTMGLRRILRIAKFRSRRTAVRLLTSDPVINGYIIFSVLLFTLYVISSDVFGAQGRNWYALEFVAFLVVTFYAPRFLPRQVRSFWTVAAVTTLGFYSLVGSAYALTSIEDRYYGPPVIGPHPRISGLATAYSNTAITIDGFRIDGRVPQNAPYRVPRSSSIDIVGWAYDPQASAPCSGFYAAVDGYFAKWARYGSDRTDVESDFKSWKMEHTGFSETIDARGLSAGRHAVALVCVSAERPLQYVSTTVLHIDVAR